MALHHADDWINAEVVWPTVNIFGGTSVFPFTSNASPYTILLFLSFYKVIRLTSSTEFSAILSKIFHMGQSTLYVFLRLGHTRVSLHDTVLTKLCNALLSKFTEQNLLSNNTQVRNADKHLFEKHIK